MIKPNDRLAIKPSMVYTELDNGEAIVMNFETRYFYGLNEIAARIWKLLDGKNCIRDIVDKIVNEYDVCREKALKSINQQIEKLIKERMVERL